MRRLSVRLLVAALALVLITAFNRFPFASAADEGWTITHFDARLAIQSSGALDVVETIQVDFADLPRHGIVREVPVVYDYDPRHNRVYDLTVLSVAAADGRPLLYQVERTGGYQSVRIGDPDVTVSGRQAYVLHYRVDGALNGFPDHDELYWNASGAWPVPIERATASVALPAPGLQRVACYEGRSGATEGCESTASDRAAIFAATRPHAAQEQMTIVAGFAKGIVPDPAPRLAAKPRAPAEYFALTPATLAGSGLASVAALGGLAWGWWAVGRDRNYTSIYYLTDDPREETRPLLARDPIVIEYRPPEGLRPAEMGLLLDERVDPLDATATIVDLAARGFLTIERVTPGNLIARLIASTDWQLARTAKDPGDLAPYEAAIYQELFTGRERVRLSELKDHFRRALSTAEDRLYAAAVQNGWFASRPDRARGFWRGVGFGLTALGGVGAWLLGQQLGAAVVALPVALGGLLLIGMSSTMPRRTARGSELLRRTLGFRRYVATAETSRQRFNEEQNVFAAYLPYAIVFGCVDRWARAFDDVERQAATAAWYVGSDRFGATAFSHDLRGFSSQLTASSTYSASSPTPRTRSPTPATSTTAASWSTTPASPRCRACSSPARWAFPRRSSSAASRRPSSR